MLTFRCRVSGGAPGAIRDYDIDESRYFALDGLPARTLPKHRERIHDALLNQERAILRAQRTSTAQDQGLE